MNFNDYQKEALRTAVYKDRESTVVLTALGLAGESGEVVEKVKKIIRDKNFLASPEDIEGLKKELGDVLWYVAVAAHIWGLDLSDVAHANLLKLRKRHEKNLIHGSGDHREDHHELS